MWKKRPKLELAFVALLAIWLLLTVTHVATGLALTIAFIDILIGTVLGFRLVRFIARQSIWRLRNRLTARSA